MLYAPTFRRGKTVDVRGLIDAFDPEKYDVVVKLHPLYRAGTDENSPEGGRTNVIYDDRFSSYDWLSVADMIISDYSSLVVEATLAGKPLFIYAYDLDEYEASTGLNMDFCSEPIAPYVFRDARELAECVDKDAYDFDALHAFRDRYIDIDTGNCTSALADFIESLVPER